jgi:3-oxoacyl-[acyl-carrier-protein] synthase-3
VQDKLGATKAGAFDLSAACAGFIYGLHAGYSMVASGLYKNVMV